MGGYELFSFHKHALKMFTIRLFRRLRRLWEGMHTAYSDLYTLIVATVYRSSGLTSQCIHF